MPTTRRPKEMMLQEIFVSAEFEDDEAGAREWEPREDEDSDDPELPLDVRSSLSSRVFNEVMCGFPAPANGAGLVDAFVDARRSSSANVMRGPRRREGEASRVVQPSIRAPAQRVAAQRGASRKAGVTS